MNAKRDDSELEISSNDADDSEIDEGIRKVIKFKCLVLFSEMLRAFEHGFSFIEKFSNHSQGMGDRIYQDSPVERCCSLYAYFDISGK